MSAAPLALQQAAALARRSVRAIARQPQVVVPSIAFPLLLAALNTAAIGRSTQLPGFPPVDSFIDFFLPATIVQGVMFGALQGGSELAIDIERGFFDRLLASPVWRVSILVGRLAGAAALGAFQVVVFVTVLSAFGARVHGGVAGVAVLVLTALVLAVGIGGLGAALGLRTGSAEAVNGAFPLMFISLFMSSAFFPRQLMHGWYRAIADWNPISWLVEGLRHQVIAGFDWGQAAQALGVAGGLAVGSISLALVTLRWRLRLAA